MASLLGVPVHLSGGRPISNMHGSSLPEFMNFKLFGKTVLVVNIKFGLFLGHPLGK